MTVVEMRRDNQELFGSIMGTLQRTGHQVTGYIPVSMLFCDEDFQRMDHDSSKERKLINNWDPVLMDALKVVPHPETGNFSVVDGGHRLSAARALGLTHLECKVIENAPIDPEERKIFEAKIFLGQLPCMERLKPMQMHKARILTGDKVAITLESLLKEYHVSAVSEKGNRGIGVLGSYTRAYDIVKRNGESGLRFVFEVIKAAGFNFEANGYSADIMRALDKIYTAYGSKSKLVWKVMRKMSPVTLKGRSIAKYPERSFEVAITLFLQDYYIAESGVEPKIDMKGKIVA